MEQCEVAYNLHKLLRPHKPRLDSPVRVIFSLNIEGMFTPYVILILPAETGVVP